jgi:guanylate kinase
MAKLIVISGPSGVGKSTVVAGVLQRCRDAATLSVSATTRPPRAGEIDGQSYHFMNSEEFQARRQRGEFLECAEVFGRGQWYGTLRQPVLNALADGRHVILEIDVEGAQSIIRQFPDAVTIFIHPGSLAELERRLRGRNTESEASIARRLDVADEELKLIGLYQHVVTNHDVEQSVEQICQLIEVIGDASCTKS